MDICAHKIIDIHFDICDIVYVCMHFHLPHVQMGAHPPTRARLALADLISVERLLLPRMQSRGTKSVLY